jgi:hypothetical protein
MQHLHNSAKTINETSGSLRGQTDLRNQNDRALALIQHSLDGVEVHLGLSRTCDTRNEGRKSIGVICKTFFNSIQLLL